MTGTLHEGQYTFLIISRLSLLRMRNISEKKIVDKIKTHTLFSNFYFRNLVVYEIMWKNIVEPSRPQMQIWHMRISRWVPKTTNTYSQYVILIAFHCNNGCNATL